MNMSKHRLTAGGVAMLLLAATLGFSQAGNPEAARLARIDRQLEAVESRMAILEVQVKVLQDFAKKAFEVHQAQKETLTLIRQSLEIGLEHDEFQEGANQGFRTRR